MHLSRSFLLSLFLVIVFFPNFLLSSEKFKYSYVPKKVYENQIFPVTVLEIGSDKSIPQFRFEYYGPSRALFKKPLVVKNGNDSFYTFYFRADEDNFHLPLLSIHDNNSTTYLDTADIPVKKLKARDDFCGVLAADMKIKTSQASTYDEKNNLITLSIEAFEANLESMHLKNVVEDGIENIKRKYAKARAEYYAVVPAAQKKIRFTYFNTIKEQFVFLEAPITIIDYSVSTQSELNPKDDSFDKLKKMTFIGFTILFFLLFLWKRDFFYLIIAVILAITLVTFYIPNKKICVKEGAPLYILPTYTSQTSTNIDREINVPLLGKREEFNKIEYKNGIIGWVKDEDLCKN